MMLASWVDSRVDGAMREGIERVSGLLVGAHYCGNKFFRRRLRRSLQGWRAPESRRKGKALCLVTPSPSITTPVLTCSIIPGYS